MPISNTTQDDRVGILGLGIMGQALAANLQQDGRLTASWNRTARPTAPQWQSDIRQLAKAADTLLIVVTDANAVEAVLEPLLPLLEQHHLVIQCSTVSPAANQRFAQAVAPTGAHFVEALIAGSKPAAENRLIQFYLGGNDTAVERARPLLQSLAAGCVHVGEIGQASSAKLATNLYLAIQIAGLAECYAYARDSGLDDDAIFTVLRHNITWNKMAEFKEPKLRQQDFSPQFSIANMLKDVRLALDTARDRQLLVLLETAERQYQAAVTAGYGDEDMIAIYRLMQSG